MAKIKKQTPMYFLSLELENIRCFGGKQTLDLSNGSGGPAPWTLLLGDNAVGKTTILQCLTWMRTAELPESGIEELPVSTRKMIKKKMKALGEKSSIVKPIMDDLEDNTEIEALIRIGNDIDSTITGKYSLNSSFKDHKKISRMENHSVDVGMSLIRQKGKLEYVFAIPDCLSTFKTPNLFAYSASRHMAVQNIDKSELRDPVANLFSDSADLYDAEQVLLDLEFRALKHKNAKPLLDKVKKLLVDLLPIVRDAEDIQILGPKGFGSDDEPSGVRIVTPYGSVPLSELSLGYKTMLSWAVDLAFRLLRNNPKSPAPLEEPAIVIVDEIDLHLHPSWQRVVRSLLCEHFPNVQFICTAHSPFMAQASEDENVALLIQDGDHVTIENDPLLIRGWRIDQVATSLLGLPVRSFEIEKLIKERQGILGLTKKKPDDLKRLEELDTILLELPTEIDPENQKAMDLIRQAAAKLNQA